MGFIPPKRRVHNVEVRIVRASSNLRETPAPESHGVFLAVAVIVAGIGGFLIWLIVEGRLGAMVADRFFQLGGL